MTRRPKTVPVSTAVLVGVLAAAGARADVTGSYDGQMTGGSIPSPVPAAAALSQSGKFLIGTVALDGDPATVGGAYLVNGRATPKKVKITGVNPAGAVLKWRGKIVGDTVQGRARAMVRGAKLAGTLALVRNVSTADGSACDAVYDANAVFFADQVLGQALTVCTSCHVPGGQAGPTRLHVSAADPRGTARQIALLVDSANPSASRVLAKPLNLLPHGGGAQLTVGGAEEQILGQWIDLVAAAQCN